MKFQCSLGISNFLEEISSLSHSVVFCYFFALITEEGFLISPCCSLELCIHMGLSFLFSFALRFPSFHSYFVRPPHSAIFLFCISFSWGWSCNPMDCSPSGSSIRGILQARILEWVAISFSRGSSQPRDWTCGLPDPGSESATLRSPALQVGYLLLSHWENTHLILSCSYSSYGSKLWFIVLYIYIYVFCIL